MRTILFLFVSMPVFALEPAPVNYGRDVQPILANACYACHGPDDKTRKASLRLDIREAAVKKAIVVGKSNESPLIQRIVTKDAEEVMPPPHAKKPAITADQLATLRRWIDEGAKFDMHWAFAKPATPAVPKAADWASKNPIDPFIATGHTKAGLSPSPEADRPTLLRRLSLDLTGLPPTPAEVAAFVADQSPEAFGKAVDRLLGSKHFGERMAVMWLDAVRYADTGGYHSDNHRDVWMFRDYVIDSFNSNKRFDQFTREQIAGDLLPGATNEQRIASGYNRMLMTTEEGGAQAKEYTAKYAADRVRNTSSAWLGATLGCAECHNHKYDPYTQKDFYSFAAFFADVAEVPVGRQPQTTLAMPEQDAELKKLNAEIERFKGELAKVAIPADRQAKWEAAVLKDSKGVPKPVVDAIKVEAAKRNAGQKAAIEKHYREQVAPETAAARKSLAEATSKRDAYQKSLPSTLVSMSVAPRMVRVLPRGNWLDDSGEVVSPAVPQFLGNVTSKTRPTRADLANWLVSPENPLTARVFVNRLWKIAFGQGLVRNMDDFGTQGTPPTHPELLDWLASEFIRTGWDIKGMLKLMVTSNTYKQSSVSTKVGREKDPTNTWLARQNRFRLDAEFVRDNALAVAGLLNAKIGGPSTKPYQPAGYWSYLNFPRREWEADKSADQYRRGLYTYWCRSFLHPSLAAFDAPSREECTNERTRSSTPLQALVLLNDPTYVEAARTFAASVMSDAKGSPERIDLMFRRAVSRPATAEEVSVVTGLLEKHRQELKKDIDSTKKFLGIGLAPLPANVEATELAAWTSVARVILNLHETVTRN